MFGNGEIFGKESPKKDIFDDGIPGTGQYPAQRITDPSFPNHTLYVPKTPPPAQVKLPVIIFGNGGCANIGSGFTNLLTEISSHGYIAITNGPPAANLGAGFGRADGFNISSIFQSGNMTGLLSGLLRSLGGAGAPKSGGQSPKMPSIPLGMTSYIKQMTDAVD
jgi:hypothetical protein